MISPPSRRMPRSAALKSTSIALRVFSTTRVPSGSSTLRCSPVAVR